eukprot:scaffold46143_cov36-Phaeocystis_antarctica.AAC.1
MATLAMATLAMAILTMARLEAAEGARPQPGVALEEPLRLGVLDGALLHRLLEQRQHLEQPRLQPRLAPAAARVERAGQARRLLVGVVAQPGPAAL